MKTPHLPKPTIPDHHPQHSPKRQILISALVLLFLITATTLIILYGKGYRLLLQGGEPKVSKTGMLNLSSTPTGADVYVNDHLTTTTNGTINLTPGKYTVKIAKEGYNDWQKDYEIKREVVSGADATLFPKAPSLQNISTLGIQSAIIDPTGTKLAFTIASDSAKKNGIYIFDMTARSFPVLAGQSNTTQIANDTIILLSQATLRWSPDGKQILAITGSEEAGGFGYYLLAADKMNEEPQDITAIYTNTNDLWKQQREAKEKARLKTLPQPIQKFITSHTNILAWSIDDNKILYQATRSADMPLFKTPRLIGNNDLYEQRSLQEGAIYVYNMKEDYNTRLLESSPRLCSQNDTECTCDESTNCTNPFTWFSDSSHLLFIQDKQIKIVEDDGSNMTTIYSGPFIGNYVFPWPDGSKVVMLTNFTNETSSPTLYTIGLK